MTGRPANKKRWIKYLTLGALLLWTASNIHWGSTTWSGIIVYDAKGYYAYLPAAFIYHDLSFGFQPEIERKYYHTHNASDYRQEIDGKVVNKYYAGTAILEAPFFFIAHALSGLFGFPQDGFSRLYAIGINIAGIFYLLAGMAFWESTLKRLPAENRLRWVVLLAVLFGANLFFYAVVEPGMSHIYSFACFNALIWLLYRFQETSRGRYLLGMGLLAGLIVLIRPVNGIVLLGLPFFAGSWPGLKQLLIQLVKPLWRLGLAMLLAVAVVSIQLLIYKLQTGNWWVYAYQEEGFDFSQPEITNFLFSYRKGYFLYTPLALVALLGLIPIYRQSRYQFFTLSTFLLLAIYILSSWWQWWYGGSFSSRVMVEYSIFTFTPLAVLLNWLRPGPARKVLVGLIVLLALLCQVQTYQYRHRQIHWSDMDRKSYWENFLRIDKVLE
ncbi:MAG: hypothetical protein H6566_17190 [Lewinellaceae bacterium]|nr:hypothetical protein [Lewinellaceae bacterium]